MTTPEERREGAAWWSFGSGVLPLLDCEMTATSRCYGGSAVIERVASGWRRGILREGGVESTVTLRMWEP
jgi:hypothetical protein